jgi:FtsP/CotA-like multicopper oxidase with cupredoxin domain
MWHPDGDSLLGLSVAAFAEEGKTPLVPGPLLRAPRGTQIRVSVRNALAGDTITILWPSLGGSAGHDSVVVAPGEVRQVQLTASHAGTFMYRAVTNAPLSRALGVHQTLAGALIIDSTQTRQAPGDRIFVVTSLADSVDADGIEVPERSVFAINGRAWPHTERIDASVGDSLHWRIVNATNAIHPMHLHGVYFRVDQFNGPQVPPSNAASLPRWVVTQRMSVFSTMAMTWTPERPGNWLFHCHFQVHVVPGFLRTAQPSTHGNHALQGMGGLVLGISARPRGRDGAVAADARPRRLRLVAVRDSGFPDSAPSLRFVLEERGKRTQSGPGSSPAIVLRRGEPVAITVVNHLSEPTAVHWHGIELDSYFDGVPGFGGNSRRLTPIIVPRDSFEARFTPPRAGTFMYHSHVDEVRQHRAGLAGALIVREADDARPEHVLFLKSARAGPRARPAVEVNGQVNPDTIRLRVGQTTRLRIINLTVLVPSGLVILTARRDSATSTLADSLVMNWRLVAKDGAELAPEQRLTLPGRQLIAMGETYDIEVTPSSLGLLRVEFRGAGRGGLLFARVPVRVE